MKKLFSGIVVLTVFFALILVQTNFVSGNFLEVTLDYVLDEGDLFVDIVDSDGKSVGTPVIDFGMKDFSNDLMTVKKTLGVDEVIRVYNYTSNPAWTVSLAAENVANKWVSGTDSYFYNNADVNLGSLTVEPEGLLGSDANCSYSEISFGSESTFIHTTLDSIDLISSSVYGAPFCRFDLSSVEFSQAVPASQPVGQYALGMVVTVIEGVFNPPSEPLNLMVSYDEGEATLNWDAPLDAGSTPIVGYQIERSNSPWTIIETNTQSTNTTYVDNTIEEGITYSYRVSAMNSAGVSPKSDVPDYKIGYISSVGGSVSPSFIQVREGGSTLAPTTTPSENYNFVDFEITIGPSGGSLNTTTGVVSNVIGDMTVRGNFALNEHTVSYTASSGGSVNPASRVVAYGGNAESPSTNADLGYVLSNFEVLVGSAHGSLNTTTGFITNVIGDMAVRANFVLKSDQGSVTTGGCSSTTWGTNCTVTASGGDGTGAYEFEKVSGDSCSINASTGVVNSTGAGSCVVRARRLGDVNYNDSSWSENKTVTLNKQVQATVSVSCTPNPVTWGTETTCTGAGGSGTGGFTYTKVSGPCEINSSSGVVTSTGAGTCSVVANRASDTNYTEEISVSYGITLEKQNKSAPSAPSCVSSTDSSVTISSCSGCEYRRATGSAQSSNTFTGLDSSTSYYFSSRYAETGDYNESDWSSNVSCVTSFACGDEIVDSRDSITYPTVLIGSQCWIAKNSNYNVSGSWCYDNNSEHCTTYGRLYTFSQSENACPTGWSLPTDSEWYSLENSLATGTCSSSRTDWGCEPAGSKLAGNSSLWASGSLTGHADFGTSGFDLLPGGCRYTDGTFNDLGSNAQLWSATLDSTDVWRRGLLPSYTGVHRLTQGQSFGFSVRCIKD